MRLEEIDFAIPRNIRSSWSFWGMTGLLVGTFVVGGLHTLLGLPRGRAWRGFNPRDPQHGGVEANCGE